MSVDFDRTGLYFLEPAEKGEQGGLADSVFPEKTVDFAFLKVHRDVFQYDIVAVAERDVVNVYHCSIDLF